MTAIAELWKSLGLAQNEVKIYETLLSEGESSVAEIVNKSKIHRRNVYDSLNRLSEKGLVAEILQSRDRLYQAVDPHKLEEILKERERTLAILMPKLASLQNGKGHTEEVFLYRGLEAYKNEMRDILAVGKDVYVYGGKALWANEPIGGFLQNFITEVNKKKIKFYFTWDHEVGNKHRVLTEHLNAKYKILPRRFSTPSTIDVYGDRTVMFSKGNISALDEDVILTVIVNERIAAAFKTWFQLIWESI